ncbi:kinase-like protein [Aaosphaeria arxii CBS 175.79]|uniref:Kinase-like protein n=1 Tax=Aaosphaeria arxii CBS 175.79 TaxID=1450172 RepID=A0A6A5XDV7_9PLEO|nr:kinase-like protein [Aaosphaeria arxii CBS 175.79]KAF2010954.1 kinase-like protein [Aaosphaeria arxii CBS 175.79]
MSFFDGARSFRLRSLASPIRPDFTSMAVTPSYEYGGNGIMDVFKKKLPPHSSHPDFANLTLLVFEAVLEVVCVSLPGYIVARMGMFDAENQKFVANLNTQLFTPFFTKLASQLTADKLVELGVIPFIFIVQLIVSYVAALAVSRICKFNKRAKNFVIAMAVFGNSNSLPISLVISLSKTLKGLHWDRIPGDNDNEVAARGILYLLIFQQLGQLVRWTWGFNVLLAPASAYKDDDLGRNSAIENGEYSDEEAEHLLHDDSHSDYESGDITPEFSRTYGPSTSSSSSSSLSALIQRTNLPSHAAFTTPTNGNTTIKGPGNMNGNGNGAAIAGQVEESIPSGPKGWWLRFKRWVRSIAHAISSKTAQASRSAFDALPNWLQKTLAKTSSFLKKFAFGLWEFMNPPLWAMLAAIIIASVPKLQQIFFSPGSFVSNSVTRAISQSGQVAVPLILVVLGANLARNTLPKEDNHSLEDKAVEKKLVIASLISRMVLPTIIMAPLLALTAKFVPVSILDDPIFVIVCFLLTGAPSALQLAQICQINNVYMGAMSQLLFHSYVRVIRTCHSTPPMNNNPNLTDPETSPNLTRHSSHINRKITMEDAQSSRPAPTKVAFTDEPEAISPPTETPTESETGPKVHRANVSGKRLSGRPSMERLSSKERAGLLGNPSLTSLLSEESLSGSRSGSGGHHHHHHHDLIHQVSAWLKSEKSRRSARKAKRSASKKEASSKTELLVVGDSETSGDRERRPSDSSDGSLALDELATILERTLSLKSDSHKRRHSHGHKLASRMRRHSTVSSDTDYFDGAEELVPSCEATLDNTKTMAYGAGGPDVGDDSASVGSKKSKKKEKEAWATFKYEILRLAHTLKLKGWRRVPLEQSGEIDVERLSGAMTNTIYVVSMPHALKPKENQDGTSQPVPKNPPPKVLLRVYGPQVEHLIDREAELRILKRLARKRIGPRLLGTFTNGRFEEFLNAKPLTFQDLRSPDVSKQIAKRMRELHEGIDLLREEREDGPFVWQNWDKWVDRCEKIVTWLDEQVENTPKDAVLAPEDAWKQRGYVLGVKWADFRKMVEKYRQWLEDQYGGREKVNERLVFAHNDTQYGNILRLEPDGKSPLLLPANHHKQLVVIDFEYSNANLPGLEFANHFTEWCYNYHEQLPYRCSTRYYPTPDEQYRFIRAYLVHNPTYRAAGGSASNPPTPHLGPLHHSGSTTALAATAVPTTISAFMLDSRAPPGEKYSHQEQEAQAEKKTEEEIRRLMAETRLWRLANSVQWAAWGIVQAHIPDLPDFDLDNKAGAGETSKEGGQEPTEGLAAEAAADQNGGDSDPSSNGGDAAEEEEEEFDYLGYAQERAMFVWGDAIQLGMVKQEELSEELRGKIKLVEY